MTDQPHLVVAYRAAAKKRQAEYKDIEEKRQDAPARLASLREMR